MKANVKNTTGKTVIELTKEKFVGDPLFPYVKKATKYEIPHHDTLFSRYIGFYSAILSSGGDNNVITTNTLSILSKKYNISKDTMENCIKDLIKMEELIKVKRGIYMLNPRHISGGRTAEASKDLITQADAIQNTQNIQTQNNYTVIADESLMKKFMRENLKSSGE